MSDNETRAMALMDRLLPVLSNRVYIGFDPGLLDMFKKKGVVIPGEKVTIGSMISLVVQELTGKELGTMVFLEGDYESRFQLIGRKRRQK